MPRSDLTYAIVAFGGNPIREREYRTVAEELWHVGLPGYYHDPDDSVDYIAYLGEAIDVVEHGDAPWGSERTLADLRAFLEGAGVVRCGVLAHHRGALS